jgi:uncharacterized protein (TIGR02145 family)
MLKNHKWLTRIFVIAFVAMAVSAAAAPFVCGDADNNGFVNISDAVYLINYIFAGGPEPQPLLAGDANHDGMVNISDAVYLIAYIFGGGPEPDCPNQQPVLAAIGPRSVNEGATLNFSTSATDPDGTIPVMTVVGLPTNAAYVDNLNGTGTFNFSPDFTQAGVHNVTFIASDGFLADSEVVAITVNNVNRAPVLAAIGAQVVNEGANLNFIASATDPDGTIPVMTAENLPTNATYTDHGNGTATFDFNPDYTQAGIYDVRFIASDGSMADTEIVAITVNQAPELTTAGVSAITQTTAECGGNVTSDGGAAVTARGVCWSTSPTPTIADDTTVNGSGTGSFTSSITGLTAGTSYYVRAYATNSAGTGYGSSEPFTTADSNTVTDIDGNVYQTVTIGTQVWMAENLKVTHYRNGDPVPNVTDGGTWSGLSTGAYCNYNNDTGNVATYGRLYNWYGVADSRNIAPAGWHVASDAEWQTLVDYLGGSAVAGGKLKEVGTTHWNPPNTGATNESGFSALPGGYRSSNGYFYDMGSYAYFWSSTESYSYYAWYRYLYYDYSQVSRHYDYKRYGFSVRCVRD